MFSYIYNNVYKLTAIFFILTFLFFHIPNLSILAIYPALLLISLSIILFALSVVKVIRKKEFNSLFHLVILALALILLFLVING